VIGGVGEGIGIDGEGSGSFGEEVGGDGDGSGSFGVETGRLGKGVGDGSARPVTPAVELGLELRTGTPRRAHAAPAPRPASNMRAADERMPLRRAGWTAFRFIVSSCGPPTVSERHRQVNWLTEHRIDPCYFVLNHAKNRF
jgi:hypothetical protein